MFLRIEKNIIKLKHMFQDRPLSLVSAQIKRLLKYIDQAPQEVQQHIHIQYLRRRLEQRDNDVYEKMQTIALSPRIVRQLRQSYEEDRDFFHAIRQYLIASLVHT